MPSIPIHTGRNGVHTHQWLRKIPLQFSCKKKWTVDLPKPAANETPSRVNEFPQLWATTRGCLATPALPVSPHWSSWCSIHLPAGHGAPAAHYCSERWCEAEMTMTSQRRSRHRSKPHQAGGSPRGGFPINDPCHKNWGNKHLFPERRDLAHPGSISSALSTL